MSGQLIAIEGVDYSGKTTLVHNLKAVFEDFVYVREPGGTKVAEEIRAIIMGSTKDELGARTNLLLFAAARAHLVHTVIKPALAAGKTVVTDRYVGSTYAYQPEIPWDDITLTHIVGTGGLMPDKTILLDMSYETYLDRHIKTGVRDVRDELPDSNIKGVIQSYKQLALEGGWHIIDATQPPAFVFAQALVEIGS